VAVAFLGVGIALLIEDMEKARRASMIMITQVVGTGSGVIEYIIIILVVLICAALFVF
jgi:hypothetical protein